MSFHPCIFLCPSVCPSICLFFAYMYVCPSVFSSICLTSWHLPVCPSICFFLCPSVCPSVCVCLFVHLSVQLSFHPCLFLCPSVCLSNSVNLSTCLLLPSIWSSSQIVLVDPVARSKRTSLVPRCWGAPRCFLCTPSVWRVDRSVELSGDWADRFTAQQWVFLCSPQSKSRTKVLEQLLKSDTCLWRLCKPMWAQFRRANWVTRRPLADQCWKAVVTLAHVSKNVFLFDLLFMNQIFSIFFYI